MDKVRDLYDHYQEHVLKATYGTVDFTEYVRRRDRVCELFGMIAIMDPDEIECYLESNDGNLWNAFKDYVGCGTFNRLSGDELIEATGDLTKYCDCCSEDESECAKDKLFLALIFADAE